MERIRDLVGLFRHWETLAAKRESYIEANAYGMCRDAVENALRHFDKEERG